MAKAEATVDELVSMIQRGELRLPEMQRRYVWRSTRVRDLMDSLYRGYPSGAILVWDTDEGVPLQEFAVTQTVNPYQSTRLLLDGQQRLTSLSAVALVQIAGAGKRPVLCCRDFKLGARHSTLRAQVDLGHPDVPVRIVPCGCDASIRYRRS